MPTRPLRLALLAALALLISAAPAWAQDPTDESNLGDEPPIELRENEQPAPPDDGQTTDDAENGASSASRGTSNGARLPDTGAEPAPVALVGLGLLFAGVGLRLRLGAPARAV